MSEQERLIEKLRPIAVALNKSMANFAETLRREQERNRKD